MLEYSVARSPIPVTVVTQPRVNKNWLLGYTHTLNPNLYNDFRIGYHQINFDTLNPFDALWSVPDLGPVYGHAGFYTGGYVTGMVAGIAANIVITGSADRLTDLTTMLRAWATVTVCAAARRSRHRL